MTHTYRGTLRPVKALDAITWFTRFTPGLILGIWKRWL
jgi:hypothetical protein